MRQLRAFLLRLAGIFASRRHDDDTRAEFEMHVEMQAAEFVRRGMSPAEAHRQAMMSSGGLTMAVESVRDRRSLPFVETLLTDIRYGARGLRRNPGFTSIAIVTLALGIGANSAIFSVVSAVVLRPLPYGNADRIVSVASTRNAQSGAVSARDFLDWRTESKTLDALAARFSGSTVLTGSGDPTLLSQTRVSANIFDVLSIRPIAGRAFLPGEDEMSAPRVAMLSEGLWRQRFGSDPTVIGRKLVFDGFPTEIIGIAPTALKLLGNADIVMTTRFTERDVSQGARGARWLDVVARVKDGVPIEAASAEMTAVAARLEQFDPQHNKGFGVRVTPLLASMVGEVQKPLFVLLGAVGFVLLIACANVASLTLGRIATRDSEMAVRTALGAARGRIARQIVTEGLLLAMLGGTAGVVVALAGIKSLVAIAPADIPRLSDVTLDPRVVAFAFALTLFAGLLFSVAPALSGSAVHLHQRLRSAGRGALGSRSGGRSRRALVVAEMALAIVLLSGAGLLLRSFSLLRDVDPGFRAEQLATFGIALPPNSRYESEQQQSQFASTLFDGIRRSRGVTGVAASFALPLSGDSFGFTFTVVGKPAPPPDNEPRAQARVASAEYFATMGIPLIRGRLFNEGDILGSRQVLVISEAVARRYFPNENPIGQYLQTGWGQNGRKFGGEVIGIVGNVRQYALDRDPTPHMYMPFDQWPLNEFDVVVRSTGDVSALFNAARASLKQIDAQIPLNGARTMSELVEKSMGQRQFFLTLLGSFAAVAMALALVGIYGVISYSVQQRRREIGIRLALGATHRSVVRMILSEGMRMVIAGVIVGLAGTFALTRLLQSLLFQVGARDPLTFAVAPSLLVGAAMLACLLPALQAARQSPVETIRAD